MSKLFSNFTFDSVAHSYQETLSILEETLSAAREGLRQKKIDKFNKLSEYESSGEFIGEEEDGRIIWCQSDIYRYDIDTIDEAILDLNKIYIPAFYHAWERMVIKWAAPKKDFTHIGLKKALQAKSVNTHSRLDDICNLNNLIKHNNSKYAKLLFQSWPEIFNHRDIIIHSNFHSGFLINDEQMSEIIHALKHSAPPIS